jgi:hypothetical protein
MNIKAVQETTARHRRASRAAALARAQRDDAIRAAHRAGASVAALVSTTDLSPQRVAEILAGDRRRLRRATLHSAMSAILRDAGDGWLTAREIAAAINSRSLYQRRDGGSVTAAQVRARAARYPALFDASTDGSGRVRLGLPS